MSEIAELERRITAALERIGRGVDGLAARNASAAPVTPDAAGAGADTGAHRDADPARAAEARAATLQTEVDQLQQQLDARGLDLHRMRKTVTQLRETLRSLRESQGGGLAGAEALNAAMAVELAALQAEREADRAEMDAILAALKLLVAEVQDA